MLWFSIMSKLLIALTSLLVSSVAFADAYQGATVISVYQQESRGSMSRVGELLTHGEPIQFNKRFSYLVGTNKPTNAFDGHWSMTISNLHFDTQGTAELDVSMEGKDPGIYEGKSTTHVLIDPAAHTQVVHGIDGNDYLIDLRRVVGRQAVQG